jgi:hypothetical protein
MQGFLVDCGLLRHLAPLLDRGTQLSLVHHSQFVRLGGVSHHPPPSRPPQGTCICAELLCLCRLVPVGNQIVNAHDKDAISDTDVAIFVSPEFSINYYRYRLSETGILPDGGVHILEQCLFLWEYLGLPAAAQQLVNLCLFWCSVLSFAPTCVSSRG